MGNTVPPRMCREVGTAAAVGWRRPKSAVAEAAVPPAAPRRVAVVAARRERPADDNVVKGEERMTRAGRRRGGRSETAATVATMKIVLKRKDAEELVDRLNAQSARKRTARLTELKCRFRARDDGACAGGCGGATSSVPCRDAWRPRLAPIQEN